jgi:hypothetical protein
MVAGRTRKQLITASLQSLHRISFVSPELFIIRIRRWELIRSDRTPQTTPGPVPRYRCLAPFDLNPPNTSHMLSSRSYHHLPHLAESRTARHRGSIEEASRDVVGHHLADRGTLARGPRIRLICCVCFRGLLDTTKQSFPSPGAHNYYQRASL